MSDVVKDAAIITMARIYRDSDIAASYFLGTYAGDSEDDWDYYTDLLNELGLAKEVIKPKPWYEAEPAWSRTPEYIWVWVD